jgi:hypothetical protein
MLVDPSNGRVRIEHDKPRWSERLDPFFVNFTNHDDGAFTITYGAEEGETEDTGIIMQRAWDIIKRQFKDADHVRRQALRDATKDVCSKRYLDDVLKRRVNEGYLRKDRDPEDARHVVYMLGENENPHTLQ